MASAFFIAALGASWHIKMSGNAFAFVPFRLDDRGNSNLQLCQNGGDFRQRAGFVNHTQTQVIAGNHFVDGQDFAMAVMRHEGRNAVARAVFEIQRRVRNVAQNRAGRGVLARAAPVEKRVAHHVAPHKNRVKNMIDTGQHMRVRHQRRINGGLHRLAGAAFCPARFAAFDHPSNLIV